MKKIISELGEFYQRAKVTIKLFKKSKKKETFLSREPVLTVGNLHARIPYNKWMSEYKVSFLYGKI